MSDALTTLSGLLSKASTLPSAPEPAPTYFEVCGFPHYENVWSNVLEFFLDPSNEHGLAELVLESLLALAETQLDEADTSNLWVQREWTTNAGGRLDLLVETDSLVLGIENKVFAGVQNDLGDYEASLRSLAHKDQRSPLGIVLSLNGTEEGRSSEFFRDVTHPELAREIRARLGERLRNGTARYLPLLLELLANIDRLTDERTMNADAELAGFIEQNEGAITDLERRLKGFRDHLRTQVKLVGEAVEYESLGVACRQYPTRPKHALFDILVNDMKLSPGLTIATNAVLRPSGWQFDIFQRDRVANYPLAPKLKDRGIQTAPHRVYANRFTWLRDPLPFDAEPSRVVRELTHLLKAIAGLPIE